MEMDTLLDFLLQEWFYEINDCIDNRWYINDVDFFQFNWIGFLLIRKRDINYVKENLFFFSFPASYFGMWATEPYQIFKKTHTKLMDFSKWQTPLGWTTIIK